MSGRMKLPSWIIYDVNHLFIEKGKTLRTKNFKKDLLKKLSNKEEAKKIKDNYDNFFENNCCGCVCSLMECKYMEVDDNYRERIFKEILDGTAGYCNYRVNGTSAGYMNKGKVQLSGIDLRTGRQTLSIEDIPGVHRY